MAEYERRLRRLEDLAAATGERHDSLREAIQERTDELLMPEEQLAAQADIDADSEGWKAQLDAFLSAAKLAAAKSKLCH
jgi:hypothetical protein